MTGMKDILDSLDITILNIEHHTVGREWNYKHVNNPYSRIYYITAGCGTISHHGETWELTPEHLYLIPCFTRVDLHCPQQFSHYYIHFTSRIRTGIDILSIFDSHYEIQAKARHIDRSLFDRLIELNPNRELIEYDANKPIYRGALDRAIQLDRDKTPSQVLETNALMRLLLAAFFEGYDHPQTRHTLDGLVRFHDVLEHIRLNLNAPLTIADLSEIADLNATYFSNLFSKLIGMSPIQYINKRRIEKAQNLLLSTHDTLHEIARKVGFQDVYYFSRLFKKTVGVAPSHYRKLEILMHRR